MVHSTERVRHRAHLHLDPSHHHLRSTCPSWSPGHRHRSPVHLVPQSVVTPQDLFLRLWRRCRHRLPQCSIHTIWCPSSIRVAQRALTATKEQRYIPKDRGVICSVTRRIPITSSRHTRLYSHKLPVPEIANMDVGGFTDVFIQSSQNFAF
jgi:hypothetical protein